MFKFGYPLLMLSCLFLGLQNELSAQNSSSSAPKYSNEFLSIGVGAQAFGMGRAMTAVSDDVTAGYWNPAGLASQNTSLQPEASLMYASYFANVSTYNYAGFTLPIDSLGKRRFGVSIIRLGVDNIPNTLDLVSNGNIDFNKVRSFSTSDFATLLTYAWQPQAVPGLSVGTNFKIIYRGVGNFANAWGFGLDLAAKYQIKNFAVGVNVLDATQTYNMWTYNTETFKDGFQQTGNVIPENSVEITRPKVRTGVAYTLNFGDRFGAMIAADGDLTFDGQRNVLISSKTFNFDPRMGVELCYKNPNTGRKMVCLRGGAFNFQQVTTLDSDLKWTFAPSTGVGLWIKNWKIDYALARLGSDDFRQATHIVSVNFLIPSKNAATNP